MALLSIVESVKVTANCDIEGVTVVNFSAEFSNENNYANGITQAILDVEAYNKNKAKCREDAAAFTDLVYSIQDTKGK